MHWKIKILSGLATIDNINEKSKISKKFPTKEQSL